jgi:hypothetical protein
MEIDEIGFLANVLFLGWVDSENRRKVPGASIQKIQRKIHQKIPSKFPHFSSQKTQKTSENNP